MKIPRDVESNIWKYAIYLVANKRPFAAILGAYFLMIPNVTANGIGIAMLISSLAGFVFEIPSGYLSDKMGHKTALVISRVLMLMSTLLYLLAGNLLFLIFAGVFFSLSHSFHSGTGSAFMHETLQALGREDDYARVTGKISAIGFAIPITLTVLIPFLVAIDIKLPFLVVLVTDFIALLVSFTFVKPEVEATEIEEVRPSNFKEILQEGHRLRFFGLCIFFAFIGGSLFALGTFRAAYQLVLEVPVIWFGVLHGSGRVLASLLLAYSGRMKRWFTLESFLRVQLLLFAGLLVSVGLVSDWRIIIGLFILINGFQWGLSQVEVSYLMDVIRTSKYKATLLSVKQQLRQLFTAVVAGSFGYLIVSTSYKTAFLTMGLIMFVVGLPMYLYLKRKNP